jgi:hypothetical protein
VSSEVTAHLTRQVQFSGHEHRRLALPGRHPLVPNNAGRCFETDAAYAVEVNREPDILVAPQPVLEPLALTKSRTAIRNSPNLSAHPPSSAHEARGL